MKPTTGALVLTALVLAAAALYRFSGDSDNDTTPAPATLGASVSRVPQTASAERITHLEEPLRQPAAHRATTDVPVAPLDNIHRAASELALATDGPNVTRSGILDLVEALEAEVSVAEGQAKTPTEKQMVSLYADALVAYRDGLQFWDLRRFADRPGQSRELDALAAKYDIQPVKAISYTATWQKYPDAYLKIWAVGNAATMKGNALHDR